ncbi:MAG: deoxyribose-phosphate aldolase [Acidobacteriota bacterium]
MERPLARSIDHTLLKPDAPSEAFDRLIQEGRRHRFAAVCLPPVYVRRAAAALKNSGTAVCTVVGFPLGYIEPEVRIFESERALEGGADELDTVLDISWLKSGRDEEVLADLSAWVDAVREISETAVTKVILETVLLDDDEKRRAARLVARAGADFVKTSTGFAGGGATVADVELLQAEVGDAIRIKASGGIRSRADAFAMLRAGASRLGTSSGVTLVSER